MSSHPRVNWEPLYASARTCPVRPFVGLARLEQRSLSAKESCAAMAEHVASCGCIYAPQTRVIVNLLRPPAFLNVFARSPSAFLHAYMRWCHIPDPALSVDMYPCAAVKPGGRFPRHCGPRRSTSRRIATTPPRDGSTRRSSPTRPQVRQPPPSRVFLRPYPPRDSRRRRHRTPPAGTTVSVPHRPR